MQQLSTQSQEATGRYRGVQKALQSIITDMKNLVQVQIRWYATQTLLFRAVAGIQELFTFYQDLEVQVSRVASALTNQGSAARTNEIIMRKLRAEMVRTGKTAEELATILWELVSAGLSHNEAMAGVSHITNLAVAAELELSETTRIAAGIYRVFGEQLNVVGSATEKWSYIVDRLSATLNQSQVDMDGLVSGLGYLINEADAAGLEFEQVLGVLSVLNNRLLLGSKAGRSASRVLTQLTSNAKEISKVFGIDMDFSGPLDLMDLLTKLNTVLNQNMVNGELTVETFDKLQGIFGQVGKRAAVGLITNLDELQQTIDDLKTDKFTALTEAMADVKLEPLSIQITKFSNAIKVLGSTAIAPFAETLKGLLHNINELIEKLSEMPQALADIGMFAISAIGALGSLSLLVKALRAIKIIGTGSLVEGVGKMTLKLLALGTGVKKVSTGFSTASGAISKTTKLVNRFTMSSGSMALGLTKMATKLKLVGTIVLTLAVATAGLITLFRNLNQAVFKSYDELEAAKTSYFDALGTLEQEKERFAELGEEYKNAIPYTNEWLSTREKIQRLYPGFLTSVEAEIALTGDLEDSLNKLTESKRQQLEIDKLLAETDEKSVKFREDAADKLGKLSKKVAEYSSQSSDSLHFLAYGLGGRAVQGKSVSVATLEQMQEEVKALEGTLIKYAEEHKRIFNEFPQDLKPLAYMLTGLRSPMEELFTLIDTLNRVETEGMTISANFMTMFNQLTPKIRDQISQLSNVEIRLGAKLDVKTAKRVQEELSNIVDTQIFNANTSSITNRFDEMLAHIEKATTNKLKHKDWQKYLDTMLIEAKNLQNDLPPVVAQILSENEISFSNVIRDFQNKNSQLASYAFTDISAQKQYAAQAYVVLQQEMNKANELIKASYIGTTSKILSDVSVLRKNMPKEWDVIRQRVRASLAGMGTDGQKFFFNKLDETQTALFNKFIKNIKLTDEESYNLITTFEKLVKTTNIASKAAQAYLTNQLNSIRSVNDATGLFVKAMSDVAGTMRPAVISYIDENKKAITDVLAYLPVEARKILSRTTTLEKIELLKMIKETKDKIREETGSLSVQLTPSLKLEITARNYAEMYSNFTSAAKSATEEQINLTNEWKTVVLAALKDINTEFSSSAFQQMDIEKAKYDVIKKYNEQRDALDRQEKTAQILAFDDAVLQKYKETENDVARLSKKYEELNKTLEDTERAFKLTTEGVQLIEEHATDNLQNLLDSPEIFGQHIEELKAFIKADRRDITKAYNILTRDVEEEQRKFFNETVEIFKQFANTTDEGAQTWLQNIVRSSISYGTRSFRETAAFALQDLEKKIQQIGLSRFESIRQLTDATDALAKLYKDNVDTAKQTTDELKGIALRRQEINLQEAQTLLKLQYDAVTAHYTRMSDARKKDLQDLQNYLKTYKNIMSPSQMGEILNKQLDLQLKAFEEMKKQRAKDLEYAAKTLSSQIKLAKLRQEQEELLPAPLTETEQQKIDALNAANEAYESERNELLKRNMRNQAELNSMAAEEQTEQIRENFEKQQEENIRAYDARKEDIIKNNQEIAKIEEAAERRKLNQLKQSKIIADIQIAGLRNSVDAMKKALEELSVTEIQQISEIANEAFSTLGDSINNDLTDRLLEATSALANTDFDFTSLIASWENETIPQFDAFYKKLTDVMYSSLGEAVKEGSKIPREDTAQATANFKQNLDKIYIDSILKLKKQIREKIKEAAEQATFLFDITSALDPGELNLDALNSLGVQTQGLVNINKDLQKTYKEQKKELTDRINLNIQQLDIEKERYKTALEIGKISTVAFENTLQSTINKVSSRTQGTKNVTKEQIEKYVHNIRLLRETQEQLDKSTSAKDKEIYQKSIEDVSILLATQEDIYGLSVLEKGEIQELLSLYGDKLGATVRIEDLMDSITGRTGQIKDDMAKVMEYTRRFGNPFQKFVLGLQEATEELYKAATDWEQIGIDMINSLNSALTNAFTETIDELALMMSGQPTEEETGLQEQLINKNQEIAEIERKIKDLELGGIQGDETGELSNLTKQLEEARKEAAKFNEELSLAGDHSQRLSEIWKNVGKEIVKQLIKIATQMLAVLVIEMAMKALSSAFGGGGESGGLSSIGSAGGNYGISVMDLMKGGNFSILGRAKGGTFEKGFTPIDNNKTTYDQIQKLFGAKLFSSGGIATGPVMGVVGEGGQNEAIVPLPDNKSIPVRFEGGSGKSDVKIMNIVDPSMVPTVLLENPETVVNIVAADLQKRGVLYQSFKSLTEKK
jgi:TP901 family phage tail tape measure protein